MNFKEFWDNLAREIAKDDDMDYNTFKRIENNLGQWAYLEKEKNVKEAHGNTERFSKQAKKYGQTILLMGIAHGCLFDKGQEMVKCMKNI